MTAVDSGAVQDVLQSGPHEVCKRGSPYQQCWKTLPFLPDSCFSVAGHIAMGGLQARARNLGAGERDIHETTEAGAWSWLLVAAGWSEVADRGCEIRPRRNLILTPTRILFFVGVETSVLCCHEKHLS